MSCNVHNSIIFQCNIALNYSSILFICKHIICFCFKQVSSIITAPTATKAQEQPVSESQSTAYQIVDLEITQQASTETSIVNSSNEELKEDQQKKLEKELEQSEEVNQLQNTEDQKLSDKDPVDKTAPSEVEDDDIPDAAPDSPESLNK